MVEDANCCNRQMSASFTSTNKNYSLTLLWYDLCVMYLTNNMVCCVIDYTNKNIRNSDLVSEILILLFLLGMFLCVVKSFSLPMHLTDSEQC